MTTVRRRAHGLLLDLLGGAVGIGPGAIPGAPDPVWQAAVLLAAERFLAPALGAAIARLGVAPPGGARPALALLRARNAKRNEGLRAALLGTARTLNGIGVEPVLLKGAIRLVDDLYPDPSWRFLRDLDLLVPPDRAQEAHDHLVRRGFRPKVLEFVPPEDMHHLVPLLHPEAPVAIELHTALALEHTAPALEPGAMAARAVPALVDGVRLRLPHPEDQLVHLVAHVQLHHGGHAAARMATRDLLEAALLVKRHGGQDLAAALTRVFAGAGRRRVATTYLALLDRHLPGSVAPVAPTIPVRCLLAWTELNLAFPRAEAVSGFAGLYRNRLERLHGSAHGRARALRGLTDGAYWRRRGSEIVGLKQALNTPAARRKDQARPPPASLPGHRGTM